LARLGQEVGRAFPLGAQANAESVRAFANAHRAREASARGSIQIFDRCLLDALAYATVLDCLPAVEVQALLIDTVRSVRCSDQLLLLRITDDYPVNDERDETPEFRRAIEAAILTLARQHTIELSECSVRPESATRIAQAVVERHFARAKARSGLTTAKVSANEGE